MHETVEVLLMISKCTIILLIVVCFLCRLMSQFVDANIQSSVGMFTFIMSYFIYAVMRTIFYWLSSFHYFILEKIRFKLAVLDYKCQYRQTVWSFGFGDQSFALFAISPVWQDVTFNFHPASKEIGYYNSFSLTSAPTGLKGVTATGTGSHAERRKWCPCSSSYVWVWMHHQKPVYKHCIEVWELKQFVICKYTQYSLCMQFKTSGAVKKIVC